MGRHTDREGHPRGAHEIGTRMKVTKTTMFFLGRLEIFLHIHSVIKRDGTDGRQDQGTGGGVGKRTWPGQDRME